MGYSRNYSVRTIVFLRIDNCKHSTERYNLPTNDTGHRTYWTHHELLGEGHVERENVLIRLRLHRSEERYYDKRDELFELPSPRSGTRIYFHAKPYILILDMTLTFAAYPKPAPGGALGEVISTDVKKLQVREVGTAQPWYYPTARNRVM